MSERILKALMQLFAIIAKLDESNEDEHVSSTEGDAIISSFLQSELSPSQVQKYLAYFNENLSSLRGGKGKRDADRKRNSVNSVKVLRICSEINEELTIRQKYLVIIRIFEMALQNNEITETEKDFVSTVSESFNIDQEEFALLYNFILKDNAIYDDPNVIIALDKAQFPENASNQFVHYPGFNEPVVIVRIQSINLLFIRYLGSDVFYLNGQVVSSDKIHLLSDGGSFKTVRSNPVYHSEILNRFLSVTQAEQFNFTVTNLSYEFPGGKMGLHPWNFAEESGKLVGIMGGSGSGKSTLINILNGNEKPRTGQVCINGTNIHENKDETEGLIGFVSQDDLLIEELSVFDNLYFSAKLSLGGKSDSFIRKQVYKTLRSLGLHSIRHLKVGSPLKKTISGGQRKRLNIALEIIRQPSILFLDEPTSGLSSRDSLNIISLLKEMANSGKLIFVVIHQPSSEIFKLMNRLVLIDSGGYPIFDGNPIDALVHFKTELLLANAEERECHTCGNVNPEQLFDLIEAKVVDEYGHFTNERKTKPNEWYEKNKDKFVKKTLVERKDKLTSNIVKPNRFDQFKTFFLRDVLSKVANRQYLLITLLEAPILALVLSFFMKDYNDGTAAEYLFQKNNNLPSYLFISVVVSLFLGMTVAAEEIFKDQKILKREAFLNLSWGSYLFSKVGILFLISAIQSMSFVLIGNLILEIKGMFWYFFMVLFAVSCWSNIVGLIVSRTFNSAKVIYIFIPILIIPQLLFSGAIVKFSRLHPVVSHPFEVPWLGNVMTSRWAYEALIVAQAKNNELEKQISEYHSKMETASYRRDFWIPEMHKLVDQNRADFLQNEFTKENARWKNFKCLDCIENGAVNVESSKQFLKIIREKYNEIYIEANDSIETFKLRLGEKKYAALENFYTNEAVIDLVKNKFDYNKIIRYEPDKQLYRNTEMLYARPPERFLDAPMFIGKKSFFGQYVDTFWSNIVVIWIAVIGAFLTLYFDMFSRTNRFIERLKVKL